MSIDFLCISFEESPIHINIIWDYDQIMYEVLLWIYRKSRYSRVGIGIWNLWSKLNSNDLQIASWTIFFEKFNRLHVLLINYTYPIMNHFHIVSKNLNDLICVVLIELTTWMKQKCRFFYFSAWVTEMFWN